MVKQSGLKRMMAVVVVVVGVFPNCVGSRQHVFWGKGAGCDDHSSTTRTMSDC